MEWIGSGFEVTFSSITLAQEEAGDREQRAASRELERRYNTKHCSLEPRHHGGGPTNHLSSPDIKMIGALGE
jgi:hypothetical protein